VMGDEKIGNWNKFYIKKLKAGYLVRMR
jgi:hypothetical protein